MGIQDNFCPKCGKSSDQAGLCTECRIGSTPWFTCDLRVKSVHCPSCGATKVVNTWTDTNLERSGMAPDLARSAVHFHPDVKKASIEVTVEDLTVNRSRAYLKIHGTLYRKPVKGDGSVEIIWHKEQCDRCNRISGSYYEGVVQVRAEGRIPSAFEIQQATSIAQQIEDTLQAGGERLSFISDMNEIHDGVDIIVGSQHIGTVISQGITAQLGGRYSTHPKLVGEKNGRQLFRITYSVRLPRFQKHDIVVVRGKYFEIGQVDSHHLRALDFTDGVIKSLREGDIERIIGNSRNAEHAIVVYAEGDTLGILDPESHKTREFRNPKWLDAKAGQHVTIMRDGDQIVIIG